MKNFKKVAIALLFCLGFIYGCGQDKYDQLIDYNDQFVDITKTYIDGLNSAQNADEIAKAMNKYSEEFGKLIPKMQEINEKYPDLMNEKDLPQKVKESQAKATQVGMDFAASFMKSMQYITDPKVAEAQQKMGNIMQSLRK